MNENEANYNKKIKTVVIVGGNFAGLAALWPLLDEQLQRQRAEASSSSTTTTSHFRLVLIDQRDYSEYTPGILRLFCEPELLDSLAQPLPLGSSQSKSKDGIHPCHLYQFIHGRVTSIVEETAGAGSGTPSKTFRNVLTYMPSFGGAPKTLAYDYLIVATGMTYRQHPISPNPSTEVTLADRFKAWKAAHRQLNQAQRVIVLGGGAVGVELAAEIVEAYGHDKHVTLIDVAPALVTNFPPSTRTYAEKWLRDRNVTLLLNQKLQSWTDSSCTLEDGKVLSADVVYVCFGSKPNSDLISSSSSKQSVASSLLGASMRGKVVTSDTLQVTLNGSLFRDGTIFSCGDVSTPPSDDEKQAFQAEIQGKLAAENVVKLLGGGGSAVGKIKPVLHHYPRDIAGYNQMPLIFVLSLGQYDGCLGFNDLCIPGALAAIVKWVLEYTKVLEMRGHVLGRIIWKVAEAVVFFVSRTLLPPGGTQQKKDA